MEQLYKLYKQSTGICTDTRKVYSGCFFVALKGANFDGNLYVQKALRLGASSAITDDKSVYDALQDDRIVLVEDCLVGLQELARYHREKLDIPVIGITGTNGKTTTKELCLAVLSSELNCYATKGNLNNHIGVPLSILEINDDHEVAIIEMGANHVGEIADLCVIAQPNIGIITNVGKAHLEGYGSFENIIKTKNELYCYVKDNAGCIIYNLDDTILLGLIQDYSDRFSYSRKDYTADFSYQLIGDSLYAGIIHNDRELISQLFGDYNAENIACAGALGMKLNISVTNILLAIENYRPGNNRSQLLDRGSNKLILDAYNANPTSMSNAITQFVELKTSLKKILILGDMLELGSFSQIEHEKIIHYLADRTALFDKCYLVGNEFSKCKIRSSSILFFDTVTDLKRALLPNPLKSHLLFLKGSRGIRLEDLIELF